MREVAFRFIAPLFVCYVLAAVVWLASTLTAPSPLVSGPDEASAVRCARIHAKSAVAWEVCEGRMLIPEAAAVFRWLNRTPPCCSADAPLNLSGAGIEDEYRDLARSEEECLCLQVLVYAVTCSTPERAAELKDEYRRICASSEAMPLPVVIEPDCEELMARARVAEIESRSSGSAPTARASVFALRLVERRRE